MLAPPKNGTRIRVLDIPPEHESLKTLSPEEAGSRHVFMHRTETVDYGTVLAGEIVICTAVVRSRVDRTRR